GNVTRFYAANLEDVRAATRSALSELGMPITEKNESDGYLIDSRTTDGDRVRINLELQTSRIPAEGALTKVGVRVATFGDVPVSERILDQIGFHLVPAGTPVVRPPTQPALGPRFQHTASPPLLPPEPTRTTRTTPRA